MTAFRVGMKVCCVDDSLFCGVGRTGLVKGHVYVVTAVGLTNPLDAMYRPCISVSEYGLYKGHPVWASRFRPIVSRPTSIAVFQAMLTGKKAGVEA